MRRRREATWRTRRLVKRENDEESNVFGRESAPLASRISNSECDLIDLSEIDQSGYANYFLVSCTRVARR